MSWEKPQSIMNEHYRTATQQAIMDKMHDQAMAFPLDDITEMKPKHHFIPRQAGKYRFQEEMISKMQESMIREMELQTQLPPILLNESCAKRVSTDKWGKLVVDKIPLQKMYLDEQLIVKNPPTEKVTLNLVDGAYE